jgi:sortase A
MLLTAGALAVADAAATILWQEPITSIYAAYEQHAVSGDLAKLDTSLAVAAPALPIAPEQRMRTLASALEQTADAGQGIARLRIPRLGLDDVVVQGTGGASLRRGPGHYAGTALPGQPGTVGIAGHRTTYGAPFRRLDALRRGDRIDVRMPYGDFRYRVEATRIVRPEDVSVLAGAGHDRLALTACHPLYSAAQRLVVLARLENATARGAAATARAPAPAPAPSEATPPAGPSADAGAAQSPRA